MKSSRVSRKSTCDDDNPPGTPSFREEKIVEQVKVKKQVSWKLAVSKMADLEHLSQHSMLLTRRIGRDLLPNIPQLPALRSHRVSIQL